MRVYKNFSLMVIHTLLDWVPQESAIGEVCTHYNSYNNIKVHYYTYSIYN